jgi:hypothetical protein
MDDESAYDPEQLDSVPAEELLQEYHDVVHHLGICAAEGQVDLRERRWEEVLFDELLLRLESADDGAE